MDIKLFTQIFVSHGYIYCNSCLLKIWLHSKMIIAEVSVQMLHIAERINKCYPKNCGFLDWNLFLRSFLLWLSSSKQTILLLKFKPSINYWYFMQTIVGQSSDKSNVCFCSLYNSFYWEATLISCSAQKTWNRSREEHSLILDTCTASAVYS